MSPCVSILTPVYNRAHFLPAAIESVLSQDMTDLELIISDNLSSDDSAAVAERYARQDSRIKFFRNDVHVSGVENFNLCYQRSDPNSSYVALLASDDWWEPTLLARLTEVGQEYPHLACVHADMYRTDSEGRVINRYIDLYKDTTPPPGLHKAVRNLFFGNFINIMAAIINRRVWNELCPGRELLDPQLKLTPDYDLWLQLFVRGAQAYYIPDALAYYRKHDDAMTMPTRQIPRMYEEVTIFKEKLKGVCPPEMEHVRLAALQQRQAQLGFELIEAGRADEARPLLREARAIGTTRRLDIPVAGVIAALPLSQKYRASLWQLMLKVARLVGRVR